MGTVIPLFKVSMSHRAGAYVRHTLNSGYIGEGPRVTEFEQRFGAWLGNPNVLAVSSCTAALHLALELANVRGGEVITTAMTAEPTNLAILYAGAKPVWADVLPNGNLSPLSISEHLTDKTRAIMVVHYGGVPCDLVEIAGLASMYGIPIVEDAAHALGARYAGQKIGTHSDAVCFSFQAIKHMPVGDGGVLVLKSPAQMQRARSLHWFGIDRQAERTTMDISELGYKYNMNDITASIGLAQLYDIEDIVNVHINNGRWFDSHLAGIPGIELIKWDTLAEPSYWFYTILAERRDDLARKLTEKGIGNGQCHKRNDWHSVFAGSRCDLPGLDAFYSRMLHIPCGPWVGEKERGYIAETLRAGW